MSEAGEPGFRDVLRIPEIRAATVGTFVVMLGFGIVSPVLPNYARSFGVGYDAIGLLISSFSFVRLVSDPFVGRFIDLRGERAMVTLGAVIVGATSVVAGWAPTFAILLLSRAAGGFGSALFFAALLSFLLRSIPPERSGRVMSVYYGSFNVGLIAGAPLGGLIARAFGLASPLFVYGAACFISAGLFWRALHDPARHRDEVRKGGLRRLPWNRPFVTALTVNGAYAWVVAGVFSTLVPLFGTSTIGLTLGGVGVALAITTATELVTLFPAGKATDHRGRKAVLVPSLIAFAAVIAVLGLTSSTAPFMIGMGALGIASGYAGVPPAPMLGDVTPEELKGSAVAVFRFVGDLGFVLGPLVAGFAADRLGFGWAFAISALPLLVALGLVLSIEETKPKLPATGEAAGL